MLVFARNIQSSFQIWRRKEGSRLYEDPHREGLRTVTQHQVICPLHLVANACVDKLMVDSQVVLYPRQLLVSEATLLHYITGQEISKIRDEDGLHSKVLLL